MTFVNAFHCLDGVVLCADSEEGDGVNKRYVRKIQAHNLGSGWGYAVAGAGDSVAIEKFIEKLTELLEGSENYDRVRTELTVERVLEHMHSLYPDERFSIMFALYGPTDNRETRLYRTYEGDHRLQQVKRGEFACIGMDISLAQFLIEAMSDRLIGVQEATRLAVFTTWMMKHHAVGVGGPTTLFLYKHGDTEWQRPDQDRVALIEQSVASDGIYDALIQFWRSLNPDIHQPYKAPRLRPQHKA